MIPVLLFIDTHSFLAQLALYGLALVLVGYAVLMGWDSVALDAKKATKRDRVVKALMYGVTGGVVARIGLYYSLPPTAPLGGHGLGVPIHTYGVLLATGFLSAVVLAAQLARREWRGVEGDLRHDQVYDLAFWVFLSGVGGSKVLFVLVNWKDYGPVLGQVLMNPSRLVDFLSGGLVFYGGLIGATVASYLFCRVHKIDFLRLADLAIPTVSLGQCFGRLGCFSAGCCWGDVAGQAVRWGVRFPGAELAKNLFGLPSDTASLAFQSQAVDSRWVVESTGKILHEAVPGAVRISTWVAQHGHTLPVHPTQLYESLGQFFLFLGLVLWRSRRRFDGQIFGIWLMAYAVLRSTIELFRGDVERGTLHGLLEWLGASGLSAGVPLEAWYNISTSQFISLGMFALGATVLYRRGRGPRPLPAAGPVSDSA